MIEGYNVNEHCASALLQDVVLRKTLLMTLKNFNETSKIFKRRQQEYLEDLKYRVITLLYFNHMPKILNQLFY